MPEPTPEGGGLPAPDRKPGTVKARLTVGPYELDLTVTARFAPGQEPDMPIPLSLGFFLAGDALDADVSPGPITPPVDPEPPAPVAPAFTLGPTALSTPEDRAVPFVAGVYEVDQPDATIGRLSGDLTKYSFSFANGRMTVTRTAAMDYETEPVSTVAVRATGANGLSTDRTLVHAITNVAEAGGGTAQAIAAQTAPSMTSLTPAQTPADGFSSGVYVSTAEVAERVTNGTFSVLTGWTFYGGISISGGELRFNSPAVWDGATQPISVVPGYYYRLAYTITAITAGQVYAGFIGGAAGAWGTARNSSGTYVQALQARDGNATLKIEAGASGVIASLDNISVVGPFATSAEAMAWTPPAV